MTTMDAGNGGALKLTDEMRAAIRDALDAVCAAGYCMGQQAMRERAAKACMEYGGSFSADQMAAIAAIIRALPVEE